MRVGVRDEGVIKFRYDWRKAPLGRWAQGPAEALALARRPLRHENLIGVGADGIGYGNMSIRVGSSPRFLITGTATGGLPEIDLAHVSLIRSFSLDRNYLACEGPVAASSESLTHGALYLEEPCIGAVIHVHAPAAWRRLRNRVPTTSPDARYGTPDMARSVTREYRRAIRRPVGTLVMGGHEDGIVAFGPTLEAASRALHDALLSHPK